MTPKRKVTPNDDPHATNLPKAAKTVTIACKYGPGLVLRLFKSESIDAPAPEGMRREPKAVQYGPEVIINGPNRQSPGLVVPIGQGAAAEVAGGFALTHGVDADFWRAWLHQNQDSDMVRNGLIWSSADGASGRDRATEHASIRSGIEPLAMPTKPTDPVTDVRVRRTTGANITVSDVPKSAA